MSSVNIVWYRNDLRTHDHEALYKAWEAGQKVVPVFILDPRQFAQTSFGFPKTGSFRTRFLLEGLQDLRARLQELGGDLLIRKGLPHEVLQELAINANAGAVFYHSEYAQEEHLAEQQVEQMLASEGLESHCFQGTSLFHPDDLPMQPAKTPGVFTQFRKKVEQYSHVRDLFPCPKYISLPSGLRPGDIPTQKDLGVKPMSPNPKAAMGFLGGESAALARLDDYCGPEGLLKQYKQSRNGLLGADYSSKFSPWLAQGSLSPRTVYWKVKAYEEEVVRNQSTYWLIFELMWRDYFRYWASRHQSSIFWFEGISGPAYEVHPNEEAHFEKWKTGTTGIPFIDANIREMNQTGFMSNRGRQNVASFLINDLKVNWLRGAEYFESVLVDYDVYSNYGNWAYLAGVGADPRPNRYFHILRQAERYDVDGHFVRHWLPELSGVPKKKVHTVFQLSPEELKTYGARNYPPAMVVPESWGPFLNSI